MWGKAPLTERFSSRSHRKKKTGHPNGYRETRGKFAPSYKASAAEATEQCFDLPSRGAKLSGAVRFTPQVANKTKKTPPRLVVFFVGDPWENRTPVSALRGPCLSRLTNGPSHDC